MDIKKYITENKIDLTTNDNEFELGNLITEARLYAGITQAELAKRMGTQQPSIARAESGLIEPSVGFLEKVAEAVNTTFIPPTFGFILERKMQEKGVPDIAPCTFNLATAFSFSGFKRKETKDTSYSSGSLSQKKELQFA